MNIGTHELARGTFYGLACKCIGICVFGGASLGAFTLVIWLAIDQSDWSKVFALPLVFLAALVPTALIFGTACGLVAALIVSALARTEFVSNPLAVWCRVGAESGLLLSTAGAMLLLNGGGKMPNPLLLLLVFGVAGFGCGFLVGRTAWHQFNS